MKFDFAGLNFFYLKMKLVSKCKQHKRDSNAQKLLFYINVKYTVVNSVVESIYLDPASPSHLLLLYLKVCNAKASVYIRKEGTC